MTELRAGYDYKKSRGERPYESGRWAGQLWSDAWHLVWECRHEHPSAKAALDCALKEKAARAEGGET